MQGPDAAPAVLLAHGFAGSARNFRPQQRALRQRYRTLCYDARGHARSPAPLGADAYRMRALLEDMAGVLDTCGVQRAVVGGLSLGAAVALHFALAWPRRVRGLVLASFPAGRDVAAGFSGSAIEFADALEEHGSEAAGAQFVWGPRSGLDAGAAKLVRQGFREHPAHALAATLRGVLASLESPDELAPRLALLSAPTLIVAGENDPGSLRASETLARVIRGARFEVVEGAGHVVNLAQPKRFNALLEDFLDALPGRRAGGKRELD